MKYVYPAIFHAGKDGWYSIRFPDLPGCYSQGKSLTEAMELAQAALSEWLQYLADENEYIPDSSSIKDIKTEHGAEFVTLIYAETRMENVA
ncbi:MAG: type II toxin-antitoxin system HicB family antitoxin [Treponema sp.]|nr:type II toxin-antitoxin system HicB family antitoxin [Treponema sp.]